MLIVGRRAGSKVILRHDDWEEDIVICVTRVDLQQRRVPLVRLGIQADKSVTILREEIIDDKATATVRPSAKTVPEAGTGEG